MRRVRGDTIHRWDHGAHLGRTVFFLFQLFQWLLFFAAKDLYGDDDESSYVNEILWEFQFFW